MAVFCSSVTSCVPSVLLRYFVNDFAMVTVAPITVCHFTFQIGSIYLVKSLCFKTLSAASLTTCVSRNNNNNNNNNNRQLLPGDR